METVAVAAVGVAGLANRLSDVIDCVALLKVAGGWLILLANGCWLLLGVAVPPPPTLVPPPPPVLNLFNPRSPPR